MAYEYDRFEREDSSGSFLMGLLAGTVLGAGLGMLFAPKTGTELRNQLSESAGRLRTTANESYQQASEKVTEKVSQMVDRGKEAYDRARTTMTGGDGSTGVTGTTGSSGAGQSTGSFGGASVGPGGGYTSNRG